MKNLWISPSTTSLVAIMKILDYSCIDILALLFKLPQLASSPTPFKNPLNLGSDLSVIREAISDKITNKIGSIPTLKELYENRGVVFVGIGFSLSKQEIEYIHKETYPNMSLLDVICISLSTPGIYVSLSSSVRQAKAENGSQDAKTCLISDKGQCKVCAKGSIFLSLVRKENSVKLVDLDDDDVREKKSDALFGRSNMNRMEAAYEGWFYYENVWKEFTMNNDNDFE